MTPAELLEQEQLVDLGEATLEYTDIVAEVTAQLTVAPRPGRPQSRRGSFVSGPDTELPQNAGSAAARDRRGDWVERVVLLGPGLLYTAAFVAVPLVLLVVYSTLTAKRFGDVGRPFTTENFAKLGEPVYRSVVFTSVRLALIATLLALLIGYPAAYAISRLSRRWRTVALIAVVLPFWTNFLIRTYAWIVLLNNEGLINKLARSARAHRRAAGLDEQPAGDRPRPRLRLPAADDPARSTRRSSGSTRRLIEAATNLGAGAFTRFRTVIFPLTAQGAITGSLFVFIPSLGNFVDPRAARRRQDGDARHARPRPVPEGPELAVRLDRRPRRARPSSSSSSIVQNVRREALERERVSRWSARPPRPRLRLPLPADRRARRALVQPLRPADVVGRLHHEVVRRAVAATRRCARACATR